MQDVAYPEIAERAICETLPSGLKIHVVPKPGFTKAFAQLSVNYGSIDARFDAGSGMVEPPKGVAHFLEHKVFEQPDGGNALTTFAKTGASPNAFTSKCMTAYHFSCTDRFDQNLEILLDFVSTPHFTDDNVKKEQGIIAQEIGMVNDRPGWRVYENLMSALYANHPARDSIIGTVESIGRIDRHVLGDCYRTFYIPSNMVLSVAGDVDAKRIIQAAESILPKKYIAPPVRNYGTEPDSPAQSEICEYMECRTPMFAIGFKINEQTTGERGMLLRLTMSLLCDVLFGSSSPFFTEAYRDGLVDQDFGAEPMFFPDSAAIMLSGESRDIDEVVRRVLASVSDVSDDYFARVKRAALGMRLRKFDHFGLLCREIATASFADYDYFDTFSAFEKIEKCDIIKLAAKIVDASSMSVSKVLPKE